MLNKDKNSNRLSVKTPVNKLLDHKMRLTQFSIEQNADAAFWMGPDARFIYVNEATTHMLGYSREQLLSMTVHDINPQFPREAWPEHWKEVKERGTYTFESNLRAIDGKMIPVDITPHFLEFEGREYNCAFVRDISERKLVEEQMRSSQKEKDVLLREVHHRVKNNLQIICSLYNLQSGYIKDREAFGMVKECQNRIRAISLVHESLYHSENMSSINLREYVPILVCSLINYYEIGPDQIRVKFDIEDTFIDLNTAVPCGLIVNEIVANSLLYAFPDRMKGEVSIIIRPSGEGEIEFMLSDNGIGIPDWLIQPEKQSMGLHLIDVLISQVKGRLRINNQNGTRFHIVLKEEK